MELARRFEDLRVRAGLTKTALAKPRYTVSYVSQIESGRRTPSSEAMRFFAERMKIVVEPTGCLGFAAARHAGLPIRGKRVGILISGGNIDLARYAALLGA